MEYLKKHKEIVVAIIIFALFALFLYISRKKKSVSDLRTRILGPDNDDAIEGTPKTPDPNTIEMGRDARMPESSFAMPAYFYSGVPVDMANMFNESPYKPATEQYFCCPADYSYGPNPKGFCFNKQGLSIKANICTKSVNTTN